MTLTSGIRGVPFGSLNRLSHDGLSPNGMNQRLRIPGYGTYGVCLSTWCYSVGFLWARRGRRYDPKGCVFRMCFRLRAFCFDVAYELHAAFSHLGLFRLSTDMRFKLHPQREASKFAARPMMGPKSDPRPEALRLPGDHFCDTILHSCSM